MHVALLAAAPTRLGHLHAPQAARRLLRRGAPPEEGGWDAAARREDDEDLERAQARLLPKEIDIDMDIDEFRSVLREVLRDELGLGETELGDRWRGGELILKPGKQGTQEKRIPLDQFFHKVVMIRDKLRVLEQKINSASGLSADEKVQLQQYVTGCYGSLTTFNVLFRDREDWFVGQSSKE
ncbi:MAG: hypothetical protein OHK0013_16240 [Sandaracinaceae bacterium]